MTDRTKVASSADDFCITNQRCHDPRCRYPEPHSHGFDCGKRCGCEGRGYRVVDPEAHPHHREWVCTCVEVRPGVIDALSERCCIAHTRRDDLGGTLAGERMAYARRYLLGQTREGGVR